MLDSIYIGMSGLQGYSKGLKVIANNTANLNTPGFKSSTLAFSDMFYSDGDGTPYGHNTTGSNGHGLATGQTVLNFKAGELRQTGNSLDLAIDGNGLFTLKDESGKLHYTRAGQFEFNADGILVNRTDGMKVMGLANGNLSEITINGARTLGGKASTVVKFINNLSTLVPDYTMSNVKVIDSAGGEHTLTVKLTNTSATTPGSWKVDISENNVALGSGQIIFQGGQPVPASSKVSFNYAPAGTTASTVTLDFSTDVTSLASSSLSNLAFSSQDGYSAGTLTSAAFDAKGSLVLSYSNGQTSKGSKLSLSRFETLDAVEAVGGNLFDSSNDASWHKGVASENGFGSVKSGMIEISNVDLSKEFSDLVIMQRGYQASSQIITTANEMLQELFAMKGK